MGLARIRERFSVLARENRCGLIAYVMAGDPDREGSAAVLRALPAAGADLVELGFPFSDPMAEGPPIQRAARRSLDAGTTLAGTLEMARDFRRHDGATPLILMGYLNPLLAMGLVRFAAAAAEGGVDGLIVVDCPWEEEGPLARALAARQIALIRLVAPTTGAERLARIAPSVEGFAYFVSVAGVTGGKEARVEAIAEAVGRLKAACSAPVAVGFGVRTPKAAAEVASIADAVVVGSALVDALAAAEARGQDPVAAVAVLVAALADAVRGARARRAL